MIMRLLMYNVLNAERFESGKSEPRDGFKYVFVHDARLKSSECGAPVFDLGGGFMGVI